MSDSTILLEEPVFILRIICVLNKKALELVHCTLSLLYPNKKLGPIILVAVAAHNTPSFVI
jgi:hypothetical protein